MQFAMMRATDGHRVFVADLSPQRAGLGKTKTMPSAGLCTYNAGLAKLLKRDG
jgi:hypothetical protein